MSLPTVTTVIPALNASEWIAQSLSSVIEQQYPKDHLEIVVVDDGSSDGTAAKAEQLLAPSGIAHAVLRNASPHGPSAARNRGWRHGHGEWIQFLDADDLIDPRKIEVQVLAAQNAAEDVAVIFSRWAHLTCQNGRWAPGANGVEPSIGDDPVLDLLRSDNFVATGSQLFRRSWLEKVGGYVESYRFIEDIDLLLRIAFHGGLLRLAPSATSLFWYRQRAGSLAASDKRAFIDGCVRNARLAERYWRNRSELTPQQARLLIEIYFLGTHFYAEHDPEAFRALTREIYRVEPAFVPEGPAALRALSRLIGYARAERWLVRGRRLKRTLRGPEMSSRAALPNL